MTKFYTFILFALVANFATAQITVTDADLQSGTYNWTADQEYILDGYVFLEEGGVLNIAPGTVVKGKVSPSGDDQTSALIITRGAKINAIGEANNPIIFTTELDDISDNSDLTADDKGRWGGIIILGNGILGSKNADGTFNIEGLPSTENKGTYGGNDNNDNSGTLKYVSIRHGGAVLDADNEINGLTLGGVGAGTTIEYVEVFANKDDGIEWFGGAVSVKHAVVAFCGDDSYDFDQSWDGDGQFWFTIQDINSNRAGEFDGSESPDLKPSVSPTLANLTFIGGTSENINDKGNDAIRVKNAGAFEMYNSLLVDFKDKAIVMDNDNEGDSYDRFLNGDFKFGNNIFYQFATGSDIPSLIDTDGGDDNLLVTALTDNGTVYADPVVGGISRATDGGLDPRTSASIANFKAAATVEGDYFDKVDYIGAFANTGDYQNDNWALGWTAMDEYGYFGNKAVSNTKKVEVAALNIFPNPTSDVLTITSDLLSAETSVAIYNVDGRLVKSVKAANNDQISVNISELTAGSYIATIIDNGQVVSASKFNKQ